jgi:hypothetical protein
VDLFIDNEEIVTRGQWRNPKFRNVEQYLVHDYDLWMVTNCLLDSIQLQVYFEWIQGHQNIDADEENILPKLLNTEVDKLATCQYIKEAIPPHRGAFHSGVVCFHQKGFHVQQMENTISARESDNLLLEYYMDHGWTRANLQGVDWINMETFLKCRHPIERCNIIQLMHDWQNMGYQKSQLNQGSTSHICSHLNAHGYHSSNGDGQFFLVWCS